ncbi:MAG: phage portal protein, partial [Alphaproteobacteria bacterium]
MALIRRLRQSLGRLALKSGSGPFSGPGYAATWLTFGGASWSERSYHRLVQEGYGKNVIAQRSVRLVAECAASVPFHVVEEGRRLAAHPLADLLAAPNPMSSGRELFERIYAFLLLAGNAYVERIEGPDGRPLELHVLRPDRISIRTGPQGWPVGYDYRVGTAHRHFPVDPVSGRAPLLHFRSFNPLDDHLGLSALAAAAMGVDIHNAAGTWNKALLDNAARPSGALVFEPREGGADVLSEEQVARLKAEMEEHFQGAANAGRPFLLEGGLKWQPMAFSPADMDFINAKHVAAREVALAFGVPPMLLGIPGDNTYANYQEANRAFWRLTLLPLIDKVLAGLARWLGEDFGPAVGLAADLDALPALAPERAAHWARLEGAGFLTVNEKRAAVGLEPIAGGDRLTPSLAMPPPGDGGAPGPFEPRLARDRREAKGAEPEARADLDPVFVKVWRTRKDGSVRESNHAADGQIRFEDEFFDVGAAKLREPRDPAGPPEETINCRCIVERLPITALEGQERQRAEAR